MATHLGRTRSWAAVVFQDATLDVTTARPAGNELSVVLQTSEPLPPAIEGQDASARYQTTAQTLQQRVDLREHRIVTAISCDDVLCQTFSLPTTEASELKQMLDLQIDNLAPLPVEEVVYSFEALETTSNETRILLVVARKAVVNERIAALEAVGWRAETVGVVALAMFRELLRRGVLSDDAKLNVLVLVSRVTANLLVYTAGKIVAVRSVVLGEGDANETIREELTRTLVATEVERAGIESGRVTFGTTNETLRDGVRELGESWPGAEVLANGSSPPPSLSVCLEMAQAGPQQLNLLPAEWREQRRKSKVRQLLIRGAIAVGVIYVLVLIGFLTMIGIKKAQVHRVDSDLRKLQPEFGDARKLHDTFSAMQRRLDTKYAALEVLREVSQLLPENVKLSGFTFKKDDTVTLRGQAQSGGQATDFISRLEKSEMFAKVTPGNMRSDPGSGLTKFDVVCSLKSSVGIYGAK